jgi:hypothetical protein
MENLNDFRTKLEMGIKGINYDYTLDLNNPEDVEAALIIHENFVIMKDAGDAMYRNKQYHNAALLYEMALMCYPAHAEVKKLLEFSRSADSLQKAFE